MRRVCEYGIKLCVIAARMHAIISQKKVLRLHETYCTLNSASFRRTYISFVRFSVFALLFSNARRVHCGWMIMCVCVCLCSDAVVSACMPTSSYKSYMLTTTIELLRIQHQVAEHTAHTLTLGRHWRQHALSLIGSCLWLQFHVPRSYLIPNSSIFRLHLVYRARGRAHAAVIVHSFCRRLATASPSPHPHTRSHTHTQLSFVRQWNLFMWQLV